MKPLDKETAEALREQFLPVYEVPQFDRKPITELELLNAQPHPRPLADGFLYADLRQRLAAGGTGKTTLALYEAATLALGHELYGYVPLIPCKTIIVTAEDDRELLVARLYRIIEAMGLDSKERAQVLVNVRIWDVSSVSFRLCRVVFDVVEPHYENLIALGDCLEVEKPDWVIFDPCVSFGIGESRVNDAEQGIVVAMRILRNRLKCCVEVIHHTGKTNAREKRDDQYAGRGGTALPDGCRMVAVINPMTPAEFVKATGAPLEDDESALVMSLPKLSYCERQSDIIIKRRGYRFDMVRPVFQTPLQKAISDEQLVLKTLAEKQRAGEFYAKTALFKANLPELETLTRIEVEGAVERLLSNGQLTEKKDGTKRSLKPVKVSN